MKIKHLPIISGLLLTTLLATSCLKSDKQNYVLGTDATIHAIQLDTVFGKKVPLTIDQANNKIFNKDSLPMNADTVVNKILITNIVTGGSWITRKLDARLEAHLEEDKDTVYNFMTDSLNFTHPVELTVYAMDLDVSRKYTVTINVHKQDPDLLSWKAFAPSVALGQPGRALEAIDENLFVITPDAKVFKAHNMEPEHWEALVTTGLDGITKIDRVVSSPNKDKLYLLANQKLYSSIDGASWSEIALDKPVDELLAVSKNRIMVVGKTDDGVSSFGYVQLDQQTSEMVLGSALPEEFVTDRVVSTFYHRNNVAMLMLKSASKEKYSYVWMSENGENWDKLVSASDEKKCPFLEQPQLFYYDNRLFAFGGEGMKFYESLNGLDWNEASKKFQFPSDFPEQGANVLTVDANHYMWINFDSSNDLHRGRLNKFGHKIQK